MTVLDSLLSLGLFRWGLLGANMLGASVALGPRLSGETPNTLR
jgi:hypothetical protein